MTTGENLKTLRLFLSLSIREIARQIGISHVSWRRYELAVCKPNLVTAKKIMDYFNKRTETDFGVDLDYIYPNGVKIKL